MKLSIDIPNPLNNQATVTLDGVKVVYCLEADEENGYIIRLKTDTNGNLIAENLEPVRETVKGVVKITFPPQV